jgi:hypothetical protein
MEVLVESKPRQRTLLVVKGSRVDLINVIVSVNCSISNILENSNVMSHFPSHVELRLSRWRGGFDLKMEAL